MSPQSVQLIVFLGLIAVMYLLLIRPQQKRIREHQELISQLKKGDKVITVGGILGEIKEIKEEIVILEIAPRLKVKILKEAIGKRQ